MGWTATRWDWALLTVLTIGGLAACSAPTRSVDDDDDSELDDLTTGAVTVGVGGAGGAPSTGQGGAQSGSQGGGAQGGATGPATGGGAGGPVSWAPGTLVISEIMNNPTMVTDEFGEWFEVYNASSVPRDLDGVTILHQPGATTGLVIVGSFVVAPGEFVVFGRTDNTSQNGGIGVDYVYGSEINLNNSSDYLAIEAPDGTLIDETSWDELSGLDPEGASRNLDAAFMDAAFNDDDTHFCEATTAMASGDYGTPGALNDGCP